MELNFTDKSKTKKEIEVFLDGGEVAGFFEKVTKKIASDASVPGFRKGKVPANILEMRLGSKLKAEVFEEIFKQSYLKACEDGKLKPASYPELDPSAKLPEKNGGFSFKMTIDIMPEVKLEGYRGLLLEKEKVELTDQMVEDVFKNEQEAYAGLSPVEGRPVQKQDMASIEGERIAEDGSRDPIAESVVPVGTGNLPPEIDEGLVGMNTGDEKEFAVKQPDGKECRYNLKVKNIQEKSKIILDDDFSKQAGYNTPSQWKEDVQRRMLERVNSRISQDMRMKAVELLAEAVEVELPEAMVRSQMEYFKKFYEAMGAQTGEPVDEEKVKNLAERQVKENFVVEKIAEEEKITVSDEEVSSRVRDIAARRKESSAPDEDEVRYTLRREKVIDFVIENAEIREKEKPLIVKPGLEKSEG